jgi:formimidoylglutamate deiminase
MQTYKFRGILRENGFEENRFVTVDQAGLITAISDQFEGEYQALDVYAIPGFQNAHSHAFQYAMAGLAEKHATSQTPDDFWSWREAMYQLALSISPDDLEAIATMLYAEMLRHGYTNVAEFHYVHHDPNGRPYQNLSEMGERLVKAAKSVGIGITLIPIFYQKGGFGTPPVDGQRRFLSGNESEYLRLLEASTTSAQFYEHANVGIGIHSMRGVEPQLIAEMAKNGPQDLPFHIHVSEQLKEIEASLNYLGKRPVEWLLEHIEMNDRFHLVHATHLVDAETDGLAASGANVVLCPSTEGNLGDGIFPLKRFQSKGGKWSIGTDSHVGLNPFEELRILDYGQRLISHKRNTFYSHDEGDSGLYGIKMALVAGRKAMHHYQEEFFSLGKPFNAVLMDANAPLIATSSLQNLPSTMVYASDVSMQWGTIAHGKLVVEAGSHFKQNTIRANFVETLKKLKSRM